METRIDGGEKKSRECTIGQEDLSSCPFCALGEVVPILVFEEKTAISGMATNCGISGRFSRGLRGHP